MVNIKKNIEDNFIWRDPLDSEEAKQMALEETVPHVDIIEANKPEAGKVYALTGGPGSRCIANGNSWSESEVTDADPAAGEDEA